MYKGKVVSISQQFPIKDKDRIVAIEMNEIPGVQTITSKDYSLGGKYVYFHPDIQLSKDFCDANDLCVRKDEAGKKIGGGYFSDKRRVVAQKFGGVKSEGIIFKLDAFSYLGESAMKKLNSMKLGDEFDFIGANEVCCKYTVKQRKKSRLENLIETVKRSQYLYRLVPLLVWLLVLQKKYYSLVYRWKDFKAQFRTDKYNSNFQRHEDTEQLRFYVKTIPVGAEIIITEKIHGTSARTAYLPDTSFKGRLKGLFGINNYRRYVGSRNVVLDEGQDDPFYGTGEQFRWEMASKFEYMEPGEDFSYEIAGFTKKGPMFEQSLAKLKKDYKSLKNYKDPMVFSYGCEGLGHCREFVYKYSKLIDGKMVVQDWDTTKERCFELGLKTVPELDRFIYDGDVDKLLARINKYLANDDIVPSYLDDRHITEGICLRINGEFWSTYKHKSFLFAVLEGFRQEEATTDDNN